MSGVPHPKGPEYGRLYATPEEARASDDGTAMTIPPEDLRASLNDPEVQRVLERAARLRKSNVDFMTEVTPNLWVVDNHLARRADFHVIDGGAAEDCS